MIPGFKPKNQIKKNNPKRIRGFAEKWRKTSGNRFYLKKSQIRQKLNCSKGKKGSLSQQQEQ